MWFRSLEPHELFTMPSRKVAPSSSATASQITEENYDDIIAAAKAIEASIFQRKKKQTAERIRSVLSSQGARQSMAETEEGGGDDQL